MTSPVRSPDYCAYLLRCWHATGQAPADADAWRFSLEDPQTGARRNFTSFNALTAFLRDTLRSDLCASSSAHVDEEMR